MATEREREELRNLLSKRQVNLLEKYLGRDVVEKKIKRRGDKYVVTSESGRELGTHDTHEAAQRQLAAVEANKDD